MSLSSGWWEDRQVPAGSLWEWGAGDGLLLKVAPGVKIRASSRGMRASVGPRAARVHFGAGGTGFSTGAGPVSLYRPASGRGRRSSAGPSRTSVATYERQLRQAQKSQQANDLQAVFDAIVNLHRQEFASPTAPMAPDPQPVDAAAIRQRHEQQAVRGLNIAQRSARALARQQAAEAATRDITAATTRGLEDQARHQRQLNEQWHRLLANDPGIVFATLTDAFDHNQAPAAVAGVHHAEASVVVMAPGIEVIPERMPKLTPVGNLSITKLTKSLRNSYYLGLVCGHVLVVVKQALAAAPGLQSVRVAVARRPPADAYGARTVECMLAALFTRQGLQGVRWHSADAIRIVQDASADLRIRVSATHELLPFDLSAEPDLAALLQAIDNQDAGSPPGEDVPATRDPAALAGSQLPGVAAAPGQQASALIKTSRHDRAVRAPAPSPRLPRPGKGTRRAEKKSRKVAGIAVGVFVLLFIIIAIATGGGHAKQTGNASTAATTAPARTATPSPTPTPHAKKARPHRTSPTAPATAPAVAQPPASATAPAGCYPLSDEGTCYEPGEYCRDDDHGTSGIAGDGQAITCEDNDGWRWEPS